MRSGLARASQDQRRTPQRPQPRPRPHPHPGSGFFSNALPVTPTCPQPSPSPRPSAAASSECRLRFLLRRDGEHLQRAGPARPHCSRPPSAHPYVLAPFVRRSWPFRPRATPYLMLRDGPSSNYAPRAHTLTHSVTQSHTHVRSHTPTCFHAQTHTVAHEHHLDLDFSLLVGDAAKGSFILKEQKEVSACVLPNYNSFLSFKTYCPTFHT